MNKELKFEIGEEVWYYPLGKDFKAKDTPKEGYRKKVKILSIRKNSYGVWYMVESPSKTLFPTYVGTSVLEKIQGETLCRLWRLG
jgi:hypothetical protein